MHTINPRVAQDKKARKMGGERRGALGGTEYRNTVRKIGKYRNSVSKIYEIPIPQL